MTVQIVQIFPITKLSYLLCYSTHVMSEDVCNRRIQAGKLYSTRLLSKSGSKLPKWGERLGAPKSLYIVEESVVDPRRKTITTYTRNIAMTRLMVSVIFFTKTQISWKKIYYKLSFIWKMYFSYLYVYHHHYMYKRTLKNVLGEFCIKLILI